MNKQLNRPKGFGEILDTTFRLAKSHFSNFFMILLILVGPVYLLQALINLASGTNFLRQVGSGGGNWFEQVTTSFADDPAASTSLAAEFGTMVLGFFSIILLAIAQVSILYAVNDIKKGETFTVKGVIKKAFSRFWPIVGSSIVVMLMVFGMVVIPIIMITIAAVTGSFLHAAVGFIIAIPLLIGLVITIGLLFTRWSFFLASVAFDGAAPGLGKSWSLTHKRTWFLFGLYLVLAIIIGIISVAVEVPVMLVLGNSVLYTIILNIVSLFTSMIFAVGYAVMYFDVKVRNDAGDLKEMMADYQDQNKG
ncbi:hypothetical protein [Aquibacillus sediminis]|uniref:hypothetical protein n=1 Tax=Aquibacillus sediminis TaxID=2574734 RepID=UPI001108668B|nr:hypothetical protein [Aquibacillus sediminis]